MSPSIFIFSALPCEARPLIQHWRLSKTKQNHPFTIFVNDDKAIVVSGVGKIAMAAAIAYAMALFPAHPQPILINLGIAGHRTAELGSLFLADKIGDAEQGKLYYPQFPFKTGLPSLSLQTVNMANCAYPDDCLYDQEASAFYEIAGKFSTLELIHSLKIVSDNQSSAIDQIREDRVELWINRQLPAIAQFVETLIRLQPETAVNQEQIYAALLNKYHFTSSNAVKLKALLQRRQLCLGTSDFDWETIPAVNAKTFLEGLEKLLNSLEFSL